MKECKWYSVCPMRYFFEKGLIPEFWTKEYCHKNWKDCVRYKMEEEGKYHPDWMLPDGTLDEKLK